MMTNAGFMNAIENSFREFLACGGSSRSTRKLVPLHGAIAHDFHERLGDEYTIQSQGYGDGREGTIAGRYMDKKVDITILHGGSPVCGIAVKFAMQSYSKNGNNYFENMLGETANIRSANCPYFQVFIIPRKIPNYTKDGRIIGWDHFSGHSIHKYSVLDRDEPRFVFHAPDKMLIYVIDLPNADSAANKDEYLAQCRNLVAGTPAGFIGLCNMERFSNSVILNDYELFASKVYHSIMAR